MKIRHTKKMGILRDLKRYESNRDAIGIIKKGRITNIYRGPQAKSPCQNLYFAYNRMYMMITEINVSAGIGCFRAKDMMEKKKRTAIGE